jgi:hypothetical protein
MDAKRSGVLFRKNNVPQNTLHKQDLGVPCTRAILKMRILEPEDGGGVESQRVRITSK